MILTNKTAKPVFLLLLLVLGLTAVWFACSSKNGSRFVTTRELAQKLDLSDLTPTETKRLEQVVNSQVSPCGDNVTIAEALSNPEHCPLVILAIRFILRRSMEDYSAEEISKAYVARYAAAKGIDIPIDGSPVIGAENPVITIVIFSDFECPVCAHASDKLHELLRRYPEDIRVVYKHFPIDSHRLADHAARAAFAAHRQDKFWEMHDTLFSAIGSPLDQERIAVMADGLGLDMELFQEDLAGAGATSAIAADKKLGMQLGVSGTPTVFVNGRLLEDGIGKIDDRLDEEFLRHGSR
ncbi:MAG: thioredoxin domain-containing protein [Proteobacteria bacterium]|nr:thioredoxin domain-containing protein [Pseudomonadota bacterium]